MKGRLFKSMTAIFMAFMLLFTLAPAGYAADGDPAVQDTNAPLFNALKDAGKTPTDTHYFTEGDLKSWTGTLDLSNKGITDAGGLQYCSGITELNLSGNAGLISMPASLAGMTKLTSLYLNGYLPQTVVDSKGPPMHAAAFLAAVATLPKFTAANADYTMLNISNTDVTDASALNGCAGLKNLFWEYQDSAPVTFPTCANLNYINLAHDTTLGNAALPAIAALPAFQTLGATPALLCISATAVTNVGALAPAAGLRTLYWQSIPSLAAATGLGSLTQLTGVDLVNDTGLGNAVLTSVASLPNITTLGIGNCGITDLTALAPKTGITSLSIGLNQIKSLAPLAGMNLYSLNANNNYFSDLTPLSSMTNLTRIDVNQNYLDPAAGSPDRAVLDTIAARPGSSVSYNQQLQITIHYDADPYTDPADMTTYYGAAVTLPAVAGLPGNKQLLGWDTDNSGSEDHAGGSTVAFAWPVIPIPFDEVTFKGYFGDYTPPPPPPLSADSNLMGLTASQPMTPAFDPATLAYAVAAPAMADRVTLTATPAYGATVTIDGAAGSSHDVAIGPGETKTVPIVVTAQNGVNTTTYTVSITRATPDAACRLTGIALSPASAALSPAFSPAVTAYTVTLPSTVGSVTVTPAKPAKATMTIDGAVAASLTVSLNAGESKSVAIEVTAENDTDKTAYHITVTRPDASELMGLGCSAGTLNPAFTPDTRSYTLTLPEGTSSVTLSPVKASAAAGLMINGHSRASLKVALKNGKSSTVKVTVTSPGKVKTTYSVTVKRKPSTNASLQSLSASVSLVPAFATGTLNYTVAVPKGTCRVTIRAAKSSAYAVMTIDGKKVAKKTVTLAHGQTKTIIIVVKAQAGNTKTYVIVLTRS